MDLTLSIFHASSFAKLDFYSGGKFNPLNLFMEYNAFAREWKYQRTLPSDYFNDLKKVTRSSKEVLESNINKLKGQIENLKIRRNALSFLNAKDSDKIKKLNKKIRSKEKN